MCAQNGTHVPLMHQLHPTSSHAEHGSGRHPAAQPPEQSAPGPVISHAHGFPHFEPPGGCCVGAAGATGIVADAPATAAPPSLPRTQLLLNGDTLFTCPVTSGPLQKNPGVRP